MKIKIIDLLNMISKGEKLPKKIISRGVDWELDDETNHYYYLDDCGNNRFTKDDLFEELYELHGLRFLNEEIEIIEEKEIPTKIPKLKYSTKFTAEEFALYQNILTVNANVNDLIDYLKSKGDE